MVYQMSNHLGIGLAVKDITGGLQHGTQFIMVFNDAVVHQCNSGLATVHPRKVGVGIVGHGRPVRGPARVSNTRQTIKGILRDLLRELCHTCRAARTSQFTVLKNSDPA